MNQKNILHNKYFLYVTEFFAGMSVMAVELGASRLMAPYFSSSQIVWTVIIGVIMIAMALGNVWGGRTADKKPSPDKLYGRLLLAAVWIALIPFAGRYMIAGISLLLAVFITKNFLVWAALFTCLAIFAFPCVLLGTVTPSLVKYSVNSLDDTGKTVKGFREKAKEDGGWINGGFMVMEPAVFSCLSAEEGCVLERRPLETLAAEGKLGIYKHPGFWQCMDTQRDKGMLEGLWAAGRAPWKIWEEEI